VTGSCLRGDAACSTEPPPRTLFEFIVRRRWTTLDHTPYRNTCAGPWRILNGAIVLDVSLRSWEWSCHGRTAAPFAVVVLVRYPDPLSPFLYP
jgi:hypothetical protein